jgi:hypothetical protein
MGALTVEVTQSSIVILVKSGIETVQIIGQVTKIF